MDLALFDFDGTITTTDTWTPFMRLAVRPVRIAGWDDVTSYGHPSEV